MEFIDILDTNDKPLGITKPRIIVHQYGFRHRTVHIWIYTSKEELLIQKRAHHKDSHPGLWDISCAGHITTGMGSVETACKELNEELGILVAKEELQFLFTSHQQYISNDLKFVDDEVCDVYLVWRDLDLSHLHLQREETEAVRFIDYQLLKRLLERFPHFFVPHDYEYNKLFALLESRVKVSLPE
jgi:isopentenyl-diphosphate delta-isomerase type 1